MLYFTTTSNFPAMSFLILIVLTLCKLQLLSCEFITTEHDITSNSLDGTDNKPVSITANRYREEYVPFEDDFLDDPISSINIDYMNNAVILQFRRNNAVFDGEVETKRRSAVDKNFMRFGRAPGKSLMRFGKRQIEFEKDQRSVDAYEAGDRAERSSSGGSRDSRNDNFMRFGRDKGFMRFGKADKSMMRFGRPDKSMMRFGRPDKSMMRFGRPDKSMMRFGRGNNKSLMRFGRASDRSMMRFGRSNKNLMRFGRSDNFMRFGRAQPEFSRIDRGDNFMRFGRNMELTDDDDFARGERSDNFMRFGKSLEMEYPGFSTPYEDADDYLTIPETEFERFDRNDKNFLRSGKLDRNFMRFGKRTLPSFPNNSILTPENKTKNVENSNMLSKTKYGELEFLFNPKSSKDSLETSEAQSSESELDTAVGNVNSHEFISAR